MTSSADKSFNFSLQYDTRDSFRSGLLLSIGGSRGALSLRYFAGFCKQYVGVAQRIVFQSMIVSGFLMKETPVGSVNDRIAV